VASIQRAIQSLKESNLTLYRAQKWATILAVLALVFAPL
jgi:hypothetical protein